MHIFDLDPQCLTFTGYRSNGMSYVDILYIYAIARAGYIPQLFSLRLPNPDVVYELLEKAKGLSIEEIWAVLPGKGFKWQYAGNEFRIMHPEKKFKPARMCVYCTIFRRACDLHTHGSGMR